MGTATTRCYCPDDCGCRMPWRTNYCGCRAHDGAPKRKRVSKAQALVDFGLADSMAEARAQLRDMGE